MATGLHTDTHNMMSEQEITEKLTAMRFKESEIPEVLRDVGQIIFGNVLAAYLPSFSSDDQARIRSLRPEEFQTFLEEKSDSLPPFPQAKFDEIHDATWRDYFKAVG